MRHANSTRKFRKMIIINLVSFTCRLTVAYLKVKHINFLPICYLAYLPVFNIPRSRHFFMQKYNSMIKFCVNKIYQNALCKSTLTPFWFLKHVTHFEKKNFHDIKY